MKNARVERELNTRLFRVIFQTNQFCVHDVMMTLPWSKKNQFAGFMRIVIIRDPENLYRFFFLFLFNRVNDNVQVRSSIGYSPSHSRLASVVARRLFLHL